MAFSQTNPHAYIGYAAQVILYPKDGSGSAIISGTNPVVRVRASSFGVQMKQERTFPELIDGIVDRSAYQLGPKTVEGDFAFPLIHEGVALTGLPTSMSSVGCGSALPSWAGLLWQIAAQRDQYARLVNSLDIGVVYPDNSQMTYPGCLINTLSYKVTQGGPVDITCGVIGGGDDNHDARLTDSLFTNNTGTILDPTTGLQPNYLSPARIVTWNDFSLAIAQDATIQIQDGTGVREFTCELKNNVERYMTLNGMMVPQDITAKKRAISGNIKLLGRNAWLNYWGTTNETRFTSSEHIAFGYKLGQNNFYWATALHGVLFSIEEMTISPGEVFETTVTYDALGDCAFNYDATEASNNPNTSALANPSGSNVYGGKTRTGYSSATPFTGWTDQ